MDGPPPSARAGGTGDVIALLTDALALRADELADRMLDQLVAEIPHYRALDVATARAVRENTSAFMSCCLRVARDGRALTPAELAPFAASARRRARAGWPLSAILHAYRLSVVAWWDGVRSEVAAAAADVDTALELASVLMRSVDEVQSAVAEAYLDEAQQLSADEDRRHSQLAGTLVSAGRAAPDLDLLAERAGVRLAPDYVVVLLAVPRDPRAHPRLAQGLRRQPREHAVVATARGTDVLVLWPRPAAAPDLAAVVGSLTAQQPDLVAVVAAPVRADYAAALTEAERLLPLAVRKGPGTHRLEDLPLEALVSQVGGRTVEVVRDLLAPLTEPRAAQGDLLLTLRAFLAADGSRGRAAAALHVHPNTIGYRLDAVSAATGLDPRRWRDALLLLAALDLQDAAGPQPRGTG